MSRRRRAVAAGVAVGALVLILIAAAVELVVLAGSHSRPPPGAVASGGGLTGTGTVPPPAPPTQRPALPAPAGDALGVNVNRLFNDFAYAPSQIDAQLAAVQATGATVARSDALWEATEPHRPVGGEHDWDWSFDDRIAGSLASHGLRWLPILDYSAPWAQSIPGQDHSPPSSDADYAAYAGAFAARYGAGGSFWTAHPDIPPLPIATIEIWNEPDSGQFWLPGPAPGAYADLYLAARAAVDGVDPGIRVIIGGLTDPAHFLPALAAARPGLRGHIDGVAIHPYGTPATVLSKVRAARAALASLGMAAVPLYVTEFGWSTQPPGSPDYAPDALRAGYIRRTISELATSGCGLAAIALYTWVTPEHDPTDAQDWYGIADPGSPSTQTPDASAFTAAVHAAAADGAPATPSACG